MVENMAKKHKIGEANGFLGKNALVTGSAKRIGRATLLALAREGCNVGVHYLRSKKEALDVKKEAKSLGVKAEVFKADVRKPLECKRLIKEFVTEFGRLDILVNNVGNFIRKPLNEFEPAEWDEMIDSNLNCSYYCSKYALEAMRRQKGLGGERGNIINISMAGCENVQANTTTTAYQIAKTGILVLTRTMALMEAPNGIRVNAVSPGILGDSVVKHPVPMKRLGTGEDVANAIVFLVSGKAKYITGANLSVSGGYKL